MPHTKDAQIADALWVATQSEPTGSVNSGAASRGATNVCALRRGVPQLLAR